MPTLINRGIDDPLLELVLQKGYQVWQHVSWTADHWRIVRFHAERAGWEFVATNPAELLGLTIIHEQQIDRPFCEMWWSTAAQTLANTPKAYQARHGSGF